MRAQMKLTANQILLLVTMSVFLVISGCDSVTSPAAEENSIHTERFDAIADARSSSSCKNVRGTVTGVVDFINGPFFNTMTGDLNGQIGAYYGPDSDVRGNGKWGADLFEMGHIIITDDGVIISEDRGTASPVPSSGGTTIRVTNRYNIVGGEGLYEDAHGNMKTHGTIDFLDFAAGEDGELAPVVLDYNLRYHGRICAPALAN